MPVRRPAEERAAPAVTTSSPSTPALKGHAERPAFVDEADHLGSSVAVDGDPLRLKAMIDGESVAPAESWMRL